MNTVCSTILSAVLARLGSSSARSSARFGAQALDPSLARRLDQREAPAGADADTAPDHDFDLTGDERVDEILSQLAGPVFLSDPNQLMDQERGIHMQGYDWY